MEYCNNKKGYTEIFKNLGALKEKKQLGQTLNKPATCVILQPLTIEPKYKNSALSDGYREQIKNHLEQLVEDQELWKQSDITLEKIATMLDTNSKYLSQVINQTYGQTFPNFINEFRVREACRILKKDGHSQYTLEGIGQLVGFNSYSSFIAAFRKYTGFTPSYFRNSQKEKV